MKTIVGLISIVGTVALIFGLFIFSLGCIEKNISAEEIVAEMAKNQKEMAKEINDMSFTEVITVSIGNESRTNESDVLYKRPKRILKNLQNSRIWQKSIYRMEQNEG